MARATFVKKARKDVPNTDIKAGDSYYHWSFRVGSRFAKRFSKTSPKRSQLTQSAFKGALYDIEDDIAELKADDGLGETAQFLAEQIRELGEECQGSLDNMPEGLQQGDTGQMLQERIDACEEAASELESIDVDPDSRDDDTTVEEFWEDVLDQIQSVSLPEG
jgi:hypothetical protein